MEKLAKEGEIVFYTGEFNHAIDPATIKIMKENLICGNSYRIKYVEKYRGYLTYHYQFYDSIFWFPSKSFTKYIQTCAAILYKLK